MMACLREAGLRSEDVGSLLLVGGSSLVPLVEDRLRAIFHRPGQQVLHHEPSKAVAYGAAIHASQLAGDAAALQHPARAARRVAATAWASARSTRPPGTSASTR